jgi:hypothetical protein
MSSIEQSNVQSNIGIQISAKPITVLPNTLGKALDLRRRVEERIERLHAEFQTKNPFWDVNTNPVPAIESIQKILDRHQVLFELNHMIGAISALKTSSVTVPKFKGSVECSQDCECDSGCECKLSRGPRYSLSLGQLRDADEYLLPYLTKIHDIASSQISSITSYSNAHDQRIEQDLKEELAELDRQYKLKSEKAKQYGESLPDEDILKSDKTTAIRRAETKKSIKIDGVGVREFISTIKSFISLLQDKRNDKIDECNAEIIDKEKNIVDKLIEKSFQDIQSGMMEYQIQEFDPESIAIDMITCSAAELISKTKELSTLINNAIPYIQFVSYKKGQNGVIEHPKVADAIKQLDDIFYNLYVLMQYRQAHRTIMSLRFTALHPLTHSPCNIDAMVRLGYDDGSVVSAQPDVTQGSSYQSRGTGSRGGRGRGRGKGGVKRAIQPSASLSGTIDNTYPSLYKSLTKLETLLNSAEQAVLKEREAHEITIRKSISDKQDSRTKSGAVLKGVELEEIAKAVRASETKEVYLSQNIDAAKEKVSKLLAETQSLQSAERKAANAILRVKVPKPLNLQWSIADNFNGW